MVNGRHGWEVTGVMVMGRDDRKERHFKDTTVRPLCFEVQHKERRVFESVTVQANGRVEGKIKDNLVAKTHPQESGCCLSFMMASGVMRG